MSKLYNLARMTTATTGTGTITLGVAVAGFLTFALAGVQNGETVTYAISDGANSEIGRGVYTASGTTLTRSVLKSTNSDAAISLSGTAQVFITAAAEDILNLDDPTVISSGSALNISKNTVASLPTKLVGTLLRVSGADGAAARIQIDTWGSTPLLTASRANGTLASPTGLLANDIILNFSATGHDGSAYLTAAKAAVAPTANQDWASGANGTRIDFYCVPDGTTSLAIKGKIGHTGIFKSNGWVRNAAQFDKTSSTVLADVTGLSVAGLEAGKTYAFEANLFTTSNVGGGVKFAIAGSATATSIIYEAKVASVGLQNTIGTARATALGTAVGDVTAVTVAKATIVGTIVVNAAGTLTVQFAQNASNGTASSVLVNSTLRVWEIA